MKDNNGYRFWQRYSGLYDLFLHKDKKAYDTLGVKIRAELSTENEEAATENKKANILAHELEVANTNMCFLTNSY